MCAVTSLLVASSVWGPVGAADVDFRPTLTFGLAHDGNTAVTGDATANGDELAALTVDLAVTRRTPVERLSFSYRPSYVAYRRQTGSDYFGHLLNLDVIFLPAAQATYTLDLTASRTEQQGARLTTPSEPTTFVTRSTQTRASLGLRGAHDQRRSIVDWEFRCDVVDYSEPSNSGSGTSTTASLEGSTMFSGSTAWRYVVSEKGSVGLRVDLRRLEYQTSPTTFVETLGLIGLQEFDRKTSMSYTAGISRSSSSDIGITLASGELLITHSITDMSSLSAGIRRLVSQGHGAGGPSTDTGAYLTYTHRPPRRGLSGTVVATYWRRHPEFQAAPSAPSGTIAPVASNTISTAETLAWNFNPFVSLDLVHTFNDQTSSDPAVLDTRYNSYGFAIHWAIRGRQEVP